MTTSITTTTFVTSFVNIDSQIHINGNIARQFEKFREIAVTNINICLFVNSDNIVLATEYAREFSNIRVMPVVSIETLWVNQICSQYNDIELPTYRNLIKDTHNHLLLINSKTEFMYRAIKANPFKTSHFAWIDFDISHIFDRMTETQRKLKWLAECQTLTKSFITFPGCIAPLTINDKIHTIENIFDNVLWRFCGCFFMGDKESVLHMHELYILHWSAFIFKYKRLTWEVNFWAWLEATTFYRNKIWNINWYNADHNDTIFNIPIRLYTICLSDINLQSPDQDSGYICLTRPTPIFASSSEVIGRKYINTTNTIYDYPEIFGFVPASACYLNTSWGKKILNTRYVNYIIVDGRYVFLDGGDTIITRNLMCYLSDTFYPEVFHIMNEPIDLKSPSKHTGIQGLEDIRLFEEMGHIKFMATSYNYSNVEEARIVKGDYDILLFELSNRTVIQSPENSHCEKNWTPICNNNVNMTDNKRTRIIYKWQPLTIGYIDDGLFVSERIFTTSMPDFGTLRGSSPFIDMGNIYLGVIHFSIKSNVSSYYHIMVSLDKITLEPKCFSSPFYFEKEGIEFCLGFSADMGTYIFWISRNDRDPMMMEIDSEYLPLLYNFI